MAVQEVKQASFNNDAVTYWISYDDVSLFVTQLRCVNNDIVSSGARMWNVNTPTQCFPTDGSGPTGSLHITPAGTTEQVNIPQSQSFQVVLVQHNGRTVAANIGGQFSYPAG